MTFCHVKPKAYWLSVKSGPNLDRQRLPSEAKPFDILGKKRKRRRIFKNLINKALTGRMRPAQ